MQKQIQIGLIVSACLVGLPACVASQTGGAKSTLGEKDPARAVQLRTQLAAEYIRNRELDKAKQELDTALKIDARSLDANVMMGVLLQQEGSPSNLKKAEDYFKRAIATDGKDAQARNNYGAYLFKLDRYKEAAQQFEIAGTTLGYDQRSAALENLGRTYLKLGQDDKAEKAFIQAVKADQNGALIARLELAELFYLQQKYTLAGEMYEDYVRAVGQTNQGARALWIGLRLARARHDDVGMKVLANQLRAQFPTSAEYQRYLQLQQSSSNPEVVWK